MAHLDEVCRRGVIQLGRERARVEDVLGDVDARAAS